MSYFKILGLNKEPFSTSPDPEFFYQSLGHKTVITNLVIELRLRRGMSIVLGDVGTGKTTLSRKLVQSLRDREGFVFHIIMDPLYESEHLFLSSLVRIFGIEMDLKSASLLDLKEALEHFLFKKGVTENKTVVLIVDEAQKLEPKSLEVLRVLLNYETNEYKLLQLVLLGQLELHSTIIKIPNFIDRAGFKYTLNPLDADETREMIDFRLSQAGYDKKASLFQEKAIKRIYHVTRGYPRKVSLICHRALKLTVMKNNVVVDERTIREIIDQDAQNGWPASNSILKG
ncbi:MAG: AAA family ATPase [Planctomycetes bacterium]|nr:AAA family ATPase [Planctomycetota bacterium]